MKTLNTKIISLIMIIISFITFGLVFFLLINVGIKKNGVVDSIPKVISVETFDIVDSITEDDLIYYYTLGNNMYYLNKHINRKVFLNKFASSFNFYYKLTKDNYFNKETNFDLNSVILSYYLNLDESNSIKDLYIETKENNISYDNIIYEYKKCEVNNNKYKIKYVIICIISEIVLLLIGVFSIINLGLNKSVTIKK